MKLYPIFVNIEHKPVTVIGGGEVALRKIRDLLGAGATIRVISPRVHADIEKLKKENDSRIEIIKREYKNGDIDGASLVFSATDIADVNKEIFKEATVKGIFVNSVDDPPNCHFFIPSQVRRGDLLLAVSTSGSSPAMAARVRRTMEKVIPSDIEESLEALKEARGILLKKSKLTSSERGKLLKKIVNDDNILNDLKKHNMKGNTAEFIEELVNK